MSRYDICVMNADAKWYEKEYTLGKSDKKNLIILLIAMVVLIGGASLLYSVLKEKMDMPGLVVQGDTGESSVDNSASESLGDSGMEEELPEETPEPEQELAPDFTVYDAEGNAHKLSDFRGKPVVVNFWASWCGPCKSEMPDFQEIYDAYGEEIHFLMVNMTDGSQETVESASSYIEKSGYTFPVYYDTDMDAVYTYGVFSIPTTYFFDAEGYGIAYGQGAMDKETILRGIQMIQSAE